MLSNHYDSHTEQMGNILAKSMGKLPKVIQNKTYKRSIKKATSNKTTSLDKCVLLSLQNHITHKKVKYTFFEVKSRRKTTSFRICFP